MLFENPFIVTVEKDLLSKTRYRKIYGRMMGVDKETLHSTIL